MITPLTIHWTIFMNTHLYYSHKISNFYTIGMLAVKVTAFWDVTVSCLLHRLFQNLLFIIKVKWKHSSCNLTNCSLKYVTVSTCCYRYWTWREVGSKTCLKINDKNFHCGKWWSSFLRTIYYYCTLPFPYHNLLLRNIIINSVVFGRVKNVAKSNY